MALSTCGKCENRFFEVVQSGPSNSNFKLNFVQCSRCGNVVGVLDFYNIGQLIRDLATKLGVSI